MMARIEGTEGQDRQSYSDDQDRDSYVPDDNLAAPASQPDETNVYWRMAEALSVWYVSWSIVTETATVIEAGPPYFLHLTANLVGPFASQVEAEAESQRMAETMPRKPWPKGARVRRAWGRTKPVGTIERYLLGRDRRGQPFLLARVFWPSTRWLIDRKGTSSTLKVSALVAADPGVPS